MENIIDASSKYQNSLPISSDAILNLLKTWEIPYTRTDHVPLRTVEESKKVQDQFLSTENGGGHIKNLYLRDNKKKNILLVLEQDRVQLFIDAELKNCTQIYVHPLVNDRTLGIKPSDLMAFFDNLKVQPTWLDFN
jgi:Ala-tRNA(Pro) deacylase